MSGRFSLSYCVYWGLLEPLGQALVVPTLRALAQKGIRVAVISFEKPQDLEDPHRSHVLRNQLAEWGIRWLALRYHRRPYLPAKLIDVGWGVSACLRAERPAVVHGRTFIGGIIGALAARLTGARFVYHNEGFWPDEQVESGRWPPNDWRYRATKAAERLLYRNADGLLLLSRQSQPLVERILHQRALPLPPTAIIPSATDLSQFEVDGSPPQVDGPRLIYAGNLGGRYPIEPLVRFVAALSARRRLTRLEVLALSGERPLRELWREFGLPAEALDVRTAARTDVPERLRRSDAGLLFLKGGLGDLSGSPTKLGEYWASGLPVVCSRGIGDSEEIVRAERAGVVLEDSSQEAFEHASDELLKLFREPGLRARCRTVAERYYSLDSAVSSQISLYHKVLEGP